MCVWVQVRKHMRANLSIHSPCDGVNRTYVSSAHHDSSYFSMVFKHLSAELVSVKKPKKKTKTVSHCNLNDESQLCCFFFYSPSWSADAQM